MNSKQLSEIQNSIRELMLENKINNSITGKLKEGEFETQRYFIYVEITNTNPCLSYVFNSNEEIIIGRSVKGTSISIQDPFVSKFHCKLIFYQGYIYMQNISYGNLIEIKNGLKKRVVNPGEETVVFQNDKITLGQEKLRILLFHGLSSIEN